LARTSDKVMWRLPRAQLRQCWRPSLPASHTWRFPILLEPSPGQGIDHLGYLNTLPFVVPRVSLLAVTLHIRISDRANCPPRYADRWDPLPPTFSTSEGLGYRCPSSDCSQPKVDTRIVGRFPSASNTARERGAAPCVVIPVLRPVRRSGRLFHSLQTEPRFAESREGPNVIDN
jgi:hypothetical protein